MDCSDIRDGGGDIFGFLAIACNGVPDMVNIDDDSRLTTPSGIILISIFYEVPKATDEIEILVLFCGSSCNAVHGFVAFICAGEVLWSDHSSIGWFSHS